MAPDLSRAEKDVLQSFKPVTQCIKFIGLSLNDDHDSFLYRFLRFFTFSCTAILFSSMCAYLVLLFNDRSRASVTAFATIIHVIGYCFLSKIKFVRLILKQPVYKKLIKELIDLWPVATENDEAAEIKRKSLRTLRLGSYYYMAMNIFGVIFYNSTPVVIHFYRTLRGIPSEYSYVWNTVYPYDKSKPVYRELTYLYETFTTMMVTITAMMGSDLLFISMSSHITLLLRLLQLKIRSLGMSPNDFSGPVDCYDETISAIKVHQRLIGYINDIEALFSPLNLINVLLSSINICFVVFNIVLLEPWDVLSSKFFLAAILSQMGIICWYADEVYRASLAVADSVYESGWYRSNLRSRRAMFMLMLRAQTPVCFTTMKFTDITLMTYGSILTNSYSYFALLYTMYRN